MKFIQLSDPFSGTEFRALKFDDGSLLFDRAYSHESVSLAYNPELKAYLLPEDLLEYMPTVSLTDASNLLNVSKMRVSALCSKGQIESVKLPQMLLSYESVMKYRDDENRGLYGTGSIKDVGDDTNG